MTRLEAFFQQIRVPLSKEPDALFWYSKRTVIVPLALVFIIVLSLSYLTPPFQSPDEFNHLKRAYLLSKGEIFLENKNNVTGGNIDTGLLDYMNQFDNVPFFVDQKINRLDWSLSEKTTWSGRKQFSDLPNTAAYFPLPYIPQALALLIGENIGLPVSTTYYLARLFSLAATLGLLWAALLLYPVPLFALALFFTPMTLFQLGSTSLDSVSFATSVLAASLFMRGTDTKLSFNSAMQIGLLICLFSLATTRINMILVTLLPVVLYTSRRSHSYVISSAALIVGSLSWIFFSLTTNQGATRGPPPRETTALEVAKYYFSDPVSFFHVLFATITDSETLKNYWKMFVGILGWVDTPLDWSIYVAFGVLFATLALVSLQRDHRSLLNRGHLALACCAMVSLCLLPVIALIAWAPHPARVIVGIQGRYLTSIFILLSFSIFNKRLSILELRIGLFVIFLMTALSIISMAPALLNRYWMGETKGGSYNVQPSAGLNASSPLKLIMTPLHKMQPVGLKRIGVLFRTYDLSKPGDAQLRLEGPGGSKLVQRFSLTDLSNDRYRYFELDGKRYATGEIVSVTGEGISTMESRDAKGRVQTCLYYWYIDDKRQITPGCPSF